MNTNFIPFLVIAILLGLTSSGSAIPDEPADQFAIKCRKGDDNVVVSGDNTKTIFTIASPTGISSATIKRKGEAWPEKVVVRLQLKGLEQFAVNSDKLSLGAAVMSREGKPLIRQWRVAEEKEIELPAADPGALAIAILDAQDKPTGTLPLQNGHFEVHLPKKLFEGNPATVTLSWIDFYRN